MRLGREKFIILRGPGDWAPQAVQGRAGKHHRRPKGRNEERQSKARVFPGISERRRGRTGKRV